MIQQWCAGGCVSWKVYCTQSVMSVALSDLTLATPVKTPMTLHARKLYSFLLTPSQQQRYHGDGHVTRQVGRDIDP